MARTQKHYSYEEAKALRNSTRERWPEYHDAVEKGLIPDKDFFYKSAYNYRLWQGRNLDVSVPITFEDLYNIVNDLLNGIEAARTAASYANYDGR